MERRKFLKALGLMAAAGLAPIPMLPAAKEEGWMDKPMVACTLPLRKGHINLYRIRRSFDNKAMDVTSWHVASDENWKEVEQFLGNDNPYLQTWYDQSGNDNHVDYSKQGIRAELHKPSSKRMTGFDLDGVFRTK